MPTTRRAFLALGCVSALGQAPETVSERRRYADPATEFEVIRALGGLYLAQGKYREALETLRAGRMRGGDRPEAIQISDDLSNAFKELFLNGGADGMEPIQALALYVADTMKKNLANLFDD